MTHVVAKILKWFSIPVLLVASTLSSGAGSYQHLVDFVICLSAVIFVQRAVRSKKYFWGAGFVAVAIGSSPILPTFKVFLLLGLACIATFATLSVAFRMQLLGTD